uniref:Putative secreted protein n=1 Tax=Ixodes ricinus TaxID=34613 RepID=A0A6B0TRW6_IXORI
MLSTSTQITLISEALLTFFFNFTTAMSFMKGPQSFCIGVQMLSTSTQITLISEALLTETLSLSTFLGNFV